MIKKENHYSI